MTEHDDGDLIAAIHSLARASVLVVGDLMLDRYVYGRVERVSPEAPVPILSVSREISMPGGAGNVVRNLTALEAATAFVSVVGDDQEGSDLTALIGGQPNVEPWLLVENGRATTVKTRYIAAGQHLIRADRELVTPLPAKLGERLLKIASDAMAATSVTVLSDYRKGVLAPDLARALIANAAAIGRKVVVDPKGSDWSHYAGADVITPNRRELAAATGLDLDDEPAIVAAARGLIAQFEFGAVLCTRAEDGMSLVTATTSGIIRPKPPKCTTSPARGIRWSPCSRPGWQPACRSKSRPGCRTSRAGSWSARSAPRSHDRTI